MPSRLKPNVCYKMCDKEGQYALWKKIGNNDVDTTIFQGLGFPDMHNYAINLKYERYCRSPAA